MVSLIDLEYPIIKTHGNIGLKKDGSAVGFFRIPNTPITVTDTEKKQKHKNKVRSMLLKLKNQKNIHLKIIPKDFLLGEKMEDFSSALAEDSKEVGKFYLNKMVKDLTAEMEIPFQYDWLAVVRLNRSVHEETLGKLVYEKVNLFAKKLLSFFDYEIPIADDWYEVFEDNEVSVYQIMKAFKAKRLSDEETFYYQRMQFLRYIPHKKRDVIANRMLENVTDTQMTVVEGGFLKLETAYGSSYIDVLPLGKLPIIFNDFHIGEFVQRFSFPVELDIMAEIIDNNSIKGTMARSNTRYFNIMKEAQSSNSPQQDEIILGNKSLKDLIKRVTKKEILVEFSTNLVLSASSIDSLRKRRTIVMNYFEDIGVGVYEAKFNTPYLFQNILMGQYLKSTYKFWHHLTTAKGLSELMLFTNTFSGNRIGWYIGRVDNNLNQWDNLQEAVYASKNLVLFNATVGNKEGVDGKQTKNPHFAITGETGGGKSYLAELIFILTSFEDVKLLYLDPKRSIRKHWQEKVNTKEFQRKYPFLAKHVSSFNFVTLNSEDENNKGVIDPIVVLLDGFRDDEGNVTYDKNNAISVAKNMLFYLLSDEEINLTQKRIIGEIVTEVVGCRIDGEQVGFRTVLDLLIKDEHTAEIGKYLVSVVDNSILELAFSDGSVKGLSYDERVTVLEVADLTLPKTGGQGELSDHEKKSIALMFALGSYCRRFGERNRFEDTIEFVDEAWVLLLSNEGQTVIENMKRIGRFYNNTLGLITQSPKDVNTEDDSTGFGTIFAFKQPTEIIETLEYMGLEVNEKNISWLTNQIPGQCLYKDVYGNINMITVHTNSQGIHELLSPMKETVASSLENHYAN